MITLFIAPHQESVDWPRIRPSGAHFDRSHTCGQRMISLMTSTRLWRSVEFASLLRGRWARTSPLSRYPCIMCLCREGKATGDSENENRNGGDRAATAKTTTTTTWLPLSTCPGMLRRGRRLSRRPPAILVPDTNTQ